MSILHRMTGVGMALGAVLVVWWFLALSASPDYFAFVDRLMTTVAGDFVLTCLLAALWFHFCNGIRHLIWDTGAGLDERNVRRSAVAGWCGTALLTAGSLLVISNGT